MDEDKRQRAAGLEEDKRHAQEALRRTERTREWDASKERLHELKKLREAARARCQALEAAVNKTQSNNK
jgi:hypothetical protein